MADEQVVSWLKSAGLARFAPRFQRAGVTSSSFLQLTNAQIDSLGIQSPADRKRLNDLITQLRRASLVPLPPREQKREQKRDRPKKIEKRAFGGSASLYPLRLSRNENITAAQLSIDKASQSLDKENSSPPGSSTERIRPKVLVCIRKRPLSRKEARAGHEDVITVGSNGDTLKVHEQRTRVDLSKYVDVHDYMFDRVFNEHETNAEVYEHVAQPLVNTLFRGGRSTCFAYGQTGAGKTYTMEGMRPNIPGLYSLAIEDVFERLRKREEDFYANLSDEDASDEEFEPLTVSIAFFEIYGSKLKDLLNESRKLDCLEDSKNEVKIVGLTNVECEDEEAVMMCIDEARRRRATGVTGANDDSSRSHAVFQITLRRPKPETVLDASAELRRRLMNAGRDEDETGAEVGRLSFIDLAGSERGGDTKNSTRQTRMEGCDINKSLLALKECIRAMTSNKDHTPFRGSKLTQVLKSSLTGKNVCTVMIAAISPSSSNIEDTMNTLRYSERVKEIGRPSESRSTVSDFGRSYRRMTRSSTEKSIYSRASDFAKGKTPMMTRSRASAYAGDSSGTEEAPRVRRTRSRVSDAAALLQGRPSEYGARPSRVGRGRPSIASALPRARTKKHFPEPMPEEEVNPKPPVVPSYPEVSRGLSMKPMQKRMFSRAAESSSSTESSKESLSKMDADLSFELPETAVVEESLREEDVLFEPVNVFDRDAAMKKLLKAHNLQIDEISRLCLADVDLMNGLKDGDLDSEEYILKLRLNLSQKMSVIQVLNEKLQAFG